MRHHVRSLFVLACVSLVSAPASAQPSIQWVVVGDPGNPSDPATNNCSDAGNCGAVAKKFLISKYEITNQQYADFLNVKAADDPYGLYNPQMTSDEVYGGILRTGTPGSYSYAARPGFENKPVVYVSFWDAVRFVNWLHNGRGFGDTETGAYTLSEDGIASNTVARNPDAIVFLPSENEWYKAAYYGGGETYYEYPTPYDTIDCRTPDQDMGHMANCYPRTTLTDVGAYAYTASFYGTHDQAGNVEEWNETIVSIGERGVRGGSWLSQSFLLASWFWDGRNPAQESYDVGFRVAAAIPEATGIEWVPVGEPGNPPDPDPGNCYDTGNCGAVGHPFMISKYEITNAQYAEFLDAKASDDDPHGLYDPQMTADAGFGGIVRSGTSGSYRYAPKPHFANKPVNYVSFWDVLRFVNWLNNGQGDGDTEAGSYTLTPEGIEENTVVRNPDAAIVLPTENEWYKAAYYAGGGVYYDYPTPTGDPVGCNPPPPPEIDAGYLANCGDNFWGLTDVGAYTRTVGPSGTYDQAGNVSELNETIMTAGTRGVRGGQAGSSGPGTAASSWFDLDPTVEVALVGFRVAWLVPEPGTMACGMTAIAALAALARKRRRA